MKIAWTRINDPGNGSQGNFNLYESTSPNATPATATKVEVVGSGFTRSGLVAGTTYYYQLTTRGTSGEEGPPSVVLAATASADFTFSLLEPLGGAVVSIDDQLTMRVGIGSRYQLASVSATIGDRTVSLAPDAGVWKGTTGLAGLPVGATLLTLTATDMNGASAQAVVRFDISPSFHVTLPPQSSVARPGIRVQASCAPVACYSIQVWFLPEELLVVRGSLDQVISLASFDGRAGELDLRMSDSLASLSGSTVNVQRYVWVESSTHLEHVLTAGGPIADASESRALYAAPPFASPQEYSIHNAASPIDTFLFKGDGFVNRLALLTPTGAWIGAFDTLYNWDRGSLTKERFSGAAAVNGDFGIFAPLGTPSLTRVTFSTGARATISACGDGAVAANGDVACAGSGQIFRFRDGVTTQLTHDALPVRNSLPRTDGVNVVYTKTLGPYSSDGPYELALFDATGERVLTPSMTGKPGDATYRVNNGWVAYTQESGSGELQAWALSPGGTPVRVTHFGSSSTIEAVGPHGEVVLLNSSSGKARRYLSVSPYSSVLDIASGQGHAFFEGDNLFVFIGPTVFRVDF